MTANGTKQVQWFAALADPERAYVSPKVERRRSPIGGYGLYAIEAIAKDETVTRDAGRIITLEEFHGLTVEEQTYCYFLDDRFLLCPFDFSAPTDEWFVNHSCDANMGVTAERTCVAIRDIAAGEELTYDYAMTECESDWELDLECRCGSPACRRRITGNDWLLPDVQERYAGYFTPYLAARIEAARLEAEPTAASGR